ncbi:MAG: hypothetical protein F4Y74_07215 [Gemmatimonadales bacterium]|nr:hypothetical protein [Gemmatimonadales bacterium]
MTDTMKGDGSYGDNLSFLTHRSGRYGEFNGVRRTDSEAPFTWTVLSSQNALTEDRAMDGHGGHWIIQDGTISDPDGLDITDKFMPGDMENDLTKIGPVYFDFASPRLGGSDAPSEVQIGGAAVVAGTYYSDVKSGRAQSVSVSNITEMGSGGARGNNTQVIAVGDCSVGANVDGGRAGAGTPFVAVVDDANVVGDIPEDDATAGELSDDGGVDCYTAELQSLTDPLGNSRGMSTVRIQTAGHFGVDRGSPVIDDQEPDEVLVLKGGTMLTFEVEDPDLETGEAGTGVNAAGILAWAGSSRSRAYWIGDGFVSESDGLVMIPTHVGRTSRVGASAGEDGRHTVSVAVPDGASPANYGVTSFTFVRDTKDPEFVVSKSQSDIGFTNSPSVLATVGGVISDGSVIQKAELSIRKIAAAGDACAAGDTLSQGRTGRVARNKRDLENDTNSIEFDESFTIRRPTGTGAGPETYCFLLDVEDSATGSDGRGDGNGAMYDVGQFSVQWPEGPAAPPPGPTFEFQTADDNANPTTFTDADSLRVAEGTAAGDGMGYWVRLANVATAPTATAPLEVTVSAPAGVTVSPTTLSFTAADSALVTVSTAHDLNLTSELHMVSHSATGYEAATFPVRVTDDDFAISASVMSVTEDADSAMVIITATAGSAPAADETVTVTAAGASGAVAGDFRVTPTDGATAITVAAGMTSGMDTVYVTALDDAEMEEAGEAIELSDTGKADVNGVYAMPASIMIVDSDPDISVSLDHTSLDEGSGATVVTVTAELGMPSPGILTFTIGNVAACAAVETSVAGPTFRIDTGQMSASGTVTVTPVADIDDGNTDCAVPVTVAPAAKANGINWTLQAAEVTIVNADDSSS